MGGRRTILVGLWTALAVVVSTGCCKLPTWDQGDSIPPASPGEQVFKMDFPCENDSDLRIRQIVLSPTETRIYVRYHNHKNRSVSISTAASGQADTFFLEAADQHRHVQLRSTTGIAVSPQRQSVEPGDAVSFTLIFEPIDLGWSPIDLHEGEIKKQGTTYWNFTDIPLK